MTMHEEWTDKLSEYLDGDLPASEVAALEAHLRECRDCTAVLNDLKGVIARAKTLGARPPQADLWPAIAARTERIAQPRQVSFTLPQLAAAAVLLIALSSVVAWQVAQRAGSRGVETAPATAAAVPAQPRGGPDAPDAPDVPSGGGAVDRVDVTPVSFADAQYDAAVSDLEKAVKNGRGRLDRSTIDIVEHNLQIIDQAIAQARDALAADPANTYLSGHLVEARRRKLDLLRRAAALAESN
jgi:anti-sigma factor RsiW